jgi:hypothetical protein
MTRAIAYFVTPHGFGHAARAAAVMAALRVLDAAIPLEIFTRVPRWFFEDSIRGPFGYHDCLTDIGLAQTTPLEEDLPETARRLDAFLPFEGGRLKNLADELKSLRCGLVVCDIAPLGIAAARLAGIPSILVENFTWDWIYEGYVRDEPALRPHIEYLRAVFAAADFLVQTEPVSVPRPAHLVTRPVSRAPRIQPAQVRAALDIPVAAKAAFVTMGGIPGSYPFLQRLASQTAHFVIPGASQHEETRGNVTLLPHHSRFYHPDVLGACDAVVGKAGYSTLAEVWQAGIPFGFIRRPRFAESDVLAGYIRNQMRGFEISAEAFESGAWLEELPRLFAMPRVAKEGGNGAAEIARFILELL